MRFSLAKLLRRFALIGACLGAFSGTASAQTPAPGPPPAPGLPMWIVRDADSTIYITGTVHLLRDGMQWRNAKLDAALASASELRLELAEIADRTALANGIRALIPKYGAYDGPPVTSLLTDTERTTLADALRARGAPPEALSIIDTHMPWVALQMLGRSSPAGDAFKFDNGIDNVLALWAVEHSVPVKGMETLEVQIALNAALDFDEQLAALRYALAPSPVQQKMNERLIDATYGRWLRGETNMAEALIIFMRLGFDRESVDALLKNRNEAWAAEIEDMLKGAGVTFIAVGAGHLVGPDSLQTRLKLRGIAAERY